MKTPAATSSAFLLCIAAACAADVLQMKDGSKLEGTLVKEEPASYVFEVQVTKSIKDERIIPKADVAKLIREEPDIKAFDAIAKLYPAPDMTSVEEYGIRIKAVEKFLADHRGSEKTRQAREMLAKLKSEANEVLAGGIKLRGNIISPAEYRANAYELDAIVQEINIRALVRETRYLPALRAFNRFSADYRNTTVHQDLLPLVTQVINTYLADVGQTLAGYDAREKERRLGLERMSGSDRRVAENAIKEEMAAIELRFKQEKDAKIGWVTPQPYFKPSLEETLTFGKQELARISSIRSSTPVDAGKIYRDTLALILRRGDKTAVSSAITSARTALIPQRYLANLESAAAAVSN